MEVALVRVTPEGESQRVVLPKSRTVMGRQEGCGLRVPVAGVSRTHCEVIVENGSIVVKDLGSSNGTFVNQDRVSGSQPLTAGDLLSIGGQVFVVQVNGDPAEIDAELMFEDGLPEQDSQTHLAQPVASAAKPVAKQTAPAKSPAGKPSDESSVMDFDFEEDEDAQPPL